MVSLDFYIIFTALVSCAALEVTSMDLKCDLGWQKAEKKCFRASSTRYSFDEARDKCQEEQAELAAMETKLDERRLSRLISHSAQRSAWIGAHRATSNSTPYWLSDPSLQFTYILSSFAEGHCSAQLLTSGKVRALQCSGRPTMAIALCERNATCQPPDGPCEEASMLDDITTQAQLGGILSTETTTPLYFSSTIKSGYIIDKSVSTVPTTPSQSLTSVPTTPSQSLTSVPTTPSQSLTSVPTTPSQSLTSVKSKTQPSEVHKTTEWATATQELGQSGLADTKGITQSTQEVSTGQEEKSEVTAIVASSVGGVAGLGAVASAAVFILRKLASKKVTSADEGILG